MHNQINNSLAPTTSPFGYKKIMMLASITLALGAVALPSYADSHHNYEKTYQALENGELQSLQSTLDNVLKEYPGQPVKIELERDDGMFEYEIKILRDDGSVVKVETDAKSGKIKQIKERRK